MHYFGYFRVQASAIAILAALAATPWNDQAFAQDKSGTKSEERPGATGTKAGTTGKECVDEHPAKKLLRTVEREAKEKGAEATRLFQAYETLVLQQIALEAQIKFFRSYADASEGEKAGLVDGAKEDLTKEQVLRLGDIKTAELSFEALKKLRALYDARGRGNKINTLSLTTDDADALKKLIDQGKSKGKSQQQAILDALSELTKTRLDEIAALSDLSKLTKELEAKLAALEKVIAEARVKLSEAMGANVPLVRPMTEEEKKEEAEKKRSVEKKEPRRKAQRKIKVAGFFDKFAMQTKNRCLARVVIIEVPAEPFDPCAPNAEPAIFTLPTANIPVEIVGDGLQIDDGFPICPEEPPLFATVPPGENKEPPKTPAAGSPPPPPGEKQITLAPPTAGPPPTTPPSTPPAAPPSTVSDGTIKGNLEVALVDPNRQPIEGATLRGIFNPPLAGAPELALVGANPNSNGGFINLANPADLKLGPPATTVDVLPGGMTDGSGRTSIPVGPVSRITTPDGVVYRAPVDRDGDGVQDKGPDGQPLFDIAVDPTNRAIQAGNFPPEVANSPNPPRLLPVDRDGDGVQDKGPDGKPLFEWWADPANPNFKIIVPPEPKRSVVGVRAESAAAFTQLIATLNKDGANVCQRRRFKLGGDSDGETVFYLEYPEGQEGKVKAAIDAAKDVSFSENPDCFDMYAPKRSNAKAEPADAKKNEASPQKTSVKPNDPYFSGKGLWGQDFDDQWAIKRVGYTDKPDSAWVAAGDKLEPVIVAVIDSGIDWTHPDLDKSQLWRNPKEVPGNGIDDDGNGYVDDVIGWNFIDNNNTPWDQQGHGTFIAGVIAAKSGNGIGIAGINPAARIMPLKVLDAFGRGESPAIAEAIVYAANHGARVINLSLGSHGPATVVARAIKYAQSRGVLVVIAAGNHGKEVAKVTAGRLDGAITVGATDLNDRYAAFSNWGPKIDIAAPGVSVLSLRALGTDALAHIQDVKYEPGKSITGKDKRYYHAGGTSFSAPIVTGTASLLMAAKPKLDAATVRRIILHSARDIETAGVDNYTGYGLLDAAAAMKADPAFFLESRIDGVAAAQTSGGVAVRLSGTADADAFGDATVLLGKGNAPQQWQKVSALITKPVKHGPLIDLPAKFFAGSKDWTIRLVTKHKSGKTREARFYLKLG
ncbi:MAG: S8 family serine peptidase [Pseudolabrys sp.]